MQTKQTKPASFIIILLLVIQSLYSQNYLITFSGSGQSNTVETVEVKNIAQQTTLTLSGTDTLLLTDVVGTGILPSLSQGLIVYPNPTNHASHLEFFNLSASNTGIQIYDFSGRLLINNSFQLSTGSHAFIISGLKAGIYLVKVDTPEQTYSQRLVTTAIHRLAPKLQYEGITQIRQQEPGLKSISNIVAMQYNDGERLVIKAISDNYAHTKSLVPTESQNIDFEFIECVDGDGNHYGVVTIGEQVWMAENLKTTHYRNGTPIEYLSSDWQINMQGVYAWYDNDISWRDAYGALYNWYAVDNSNKLCPVGWHVPSIFELNALLSFLHSQGFPNYYNSTDPNQAGNALKSCRQENSILTGDCDTSEHPRWNSHDTHYGFDFFGFSGLPGGFFYPTYFSFRGASAYWWTSSVSKLGAHWFGMPHNASYVWVFDENPRSTGKSVRCMKTN